MAILQVEISEWSYHRTSRESYCCRRTKVKRFSTEFTHDGFRARYKPRFVSMVSGKKIAGAIGKILRENLPAVLDFHKRKRVLTNFLQCQSSLTPANPSQTRMTRLTGLCPQ